jgi:hypothetical protein
VVELVNAFVVELTLLFVVVVVSLPQATQTIMPTPPQMCGPTPPQMREPAPMGLIKVSFPECETGSKSRSPKFMHFISTLGFQKRINFVMTLMSFNLLL